MKTSADELRRELVQTWLRLQTNGLSKKKAVVALSWKILVRSWAWASTRPATANSRVNPDSSLSRTAAARMPSKLGGPRVPTPGEGRHFFASRSRRHGVRGPLGEKMPFKSTVPPATLRIREVGEPAT